MTAVSEERSTRTRGRRKTDEEAAAIVARAHEIAPEIKSPFRPQEARSLMTIVGRRDPIAVAGIPTDALDGRDPEQVLEDWTRFRLEARDPAARALQKNAKKISEDPRAHRLWGRQVGALLLAIKDARR